MTTDGWLALAWILYAIFEYWIGRTPLLRAGSLIELILLATADVLGRKSKP